MEITSATFIKGIRGTDPITDIDMPHVAFLGRSNVGKSSTINMLSGRNKLVKSSSTPGKTQEVNFFLINEEFYFVDLPGYGYAKLSKKAREKLRKLIWWYVTDTHPESRTFVIVLDASVGMTEYDMELFDDLMKEEQEVVIVLNKIDKLNQSKRTKIVRGMQEMFNVPVVPISAKKGKGRDVLMSTLFSAE